jgi:hypothetical protein
MTIDFFVMRALVAGIHAFIKIETGVDGRDRPGHDGAAHDD